MAELPNHSFETPREASRQTRATNAPPISDNPMTSGSPRRRHLQSQKLYSDRYIPNRMGVDLQAAFSLSSQDIVAKAAMEDDENEMEVRKEQEANHTFSTVLKAELFGDNVPMATANLHSSHRAKTPPASESESESVTPRRPKKTTNVFTYSSPKKNRSNGRDLQQELYSLSPVRSDSQRLLLSPQKKLRTISKVPYRVLDAPELCDDFYLNLVDWGSQDVLAVGLGDSVYLWDSATQSVERLCNLAKRDKVTSISWIGSGSHVAIGTNKGLVEIWDATKIKCVRTMAGHSLRVSSLAWNEHILSSGSRDRSILNRDVREANPFVNRFESHKQEVCGLKWNVDENKLASGGNDNQLYVWDGLNPKPLHTFSDHTAAVKAIAWSPHQRGVLASGGGTADKTLKTWNTLTGSLVHDVHTGSQVCNLIWSKNSNELVSTHGYSRNQIIVWKYPSMQQLAQLTGHTYRVLYLSLSPDGETIVTGAGDETLRFWNVFEKNKQSEAPQSVLLDAFSQLR
ncbi:APC/C activator protein Cdh1p [Diutina rugosa]